MNRNTGAQPDCILFGRIVVDDIPFAIAIVGFRTEKEQVTPFATPHAIMTSALADDQFVKRSPNKIVPTARPGNDPNGRCVTPSAGYSNCLAEKARNIECH